MYGVPTGLAMLLMDQCCCLHKPVAYLHQLVQFMLFQVLLSAESGIWWPLASCVGHAAVLQGAAGAVPCFDYSLLHAGATVQ